MPVQLAVLWHQHQPYYVDDLSGETPLPWVRLHGTKDYLGMALHLEAVPEFRCTINLTPVLLKQMLRYTGGDGSDRHLLVSRQPADGLTEQAARFVLNDFFCAHFDHVIRPHARFLQLHRKRYDAEKSLERALAEFSVEELRDLQVWSNLAWIHNLVFERDADLREFREKGRDYSEDDKAWLLGRQMDLLREVIPLHRRLAERGQVELTTTPLYHPILPLLWDKRCARENMPDCILPEHVEPYREDAAVHLSRAVEMHAELFGGRPRGMWPSEGSVSHDVVGPIASAGIEWIATDEEVLGASLPDIEPAGIRHRPDLLYRPWRMEDGERSLQMIFRDHVLSDLIGFHYQRTDPLRAADDLLGRIRSAERALGGDPRPPLVSIILDGENCWEHYPGGGVEFLRTFYQRCVDDAHVQPTTVSGCLDSHPATDRIDRLSAGSWIAHNFYIWIGHADDRIAWDRLHEARQTIVAAEQAGAASQDAITSAWEELYIAQGSDWFWWYGDDHSTPQDDVFDRAFRTHLRNVYTLLQVPVPPQLHEPISHVVREHPTPTGRVAATIDGRSDENEWVNAGCCRGGAHGTMAEQSGLHLRTLYYGFEGERLMLRIDSVDRAESALESLDRLRIVVEDRAELSITWPHAADAVQVAATATHGGELDAIQVAADDVLELSIPLSSLHAGTGDVLRVFSEAFADGRSIDRLPRHAVVELTVP